MLRTLAIATLLASCVVDATPVSDPPVEPDSTAFAVLPPPSHTGPGFITCGRSNAPSITCPIPAQVCRYSPSYINTSACVQAQALTSGFSWITVDGPEDCAGARACFSGLQYPWGARYKTVCQAECSAAAFDPGDPANAFDNGDPIDYGTLCNPELAVTGCPVGLSCVMAGAPSGPFNVNHGSLLRYLWLCR